MVIKKLFIVILIIILFIISSVIFYFIIVSQNYGRLSGVVTKVAEPGITGEIGFEKVYANATVEVYAIKKEYTDKGIIETVDKLARKTKTDKDGEFSVSLSPGIYQIKAFYGENLKSDDVRVEIKMGRTTRVEILLKEV